MLTTAKITLNGFIKQLNDFKYCAQNFADIRVSKRDFNNYLVEMKISRFHERSSTSNRPLNLNGS